MKKGWFERKKYSPKLKKRVAPEHRKARLKSVRDYKRLAELSQKKREKALQKRAERRMKKKIRPKGERRYFTKKDIRQEYNIGKPSPLPRSRQLENLGYEPSKKPPIHTNERKAIAQSNYKKGLRTKFIYLGGNKWRTYSKKREPKEKKYEGERDQYGIVKGTAPEKPQKQTKITHGWSEAETGTPMERPEYYEEAREREKSFETSAGEEISPPKKRETLVVRGEKLIQKREEPEKRVIIDMTPKEKAEELEKLKEKRLEYGKVMKRKKVGEFNKYD